MPRFDFKHEGQTYDVEYSTRYSWEEPYNMEVYNADTCQDMKEDDVIMDMAWDYACNLIAEGYE